MHLRLVIVLSLLFLFLSSPKGATSATIKGHIYDGLTGELVRGSTIHLESTDKYATSGLDGSFTIENVVPGPYKIVVTCVSFSSFTRIITIRQDEVMVIEQDEVMVIEIELDPNNQKELKEIIVTDKKDGSSERGARNLEQSAPQIMNIISSQAIKISPDLMVANLLQRVSEVSIELDNSGDGECATAWYG